VVANAAVVDRIRDAERIDPEAWRAELEVNLTGAFLSLQPALAGMRERGGGRIVAIASTAATDGLAGQAAYAASKAGLLGLVRTLDLEMAPAGVTVNAVLPGMVATEKVEAMPAEVRDRAVLPHPPPALRHPGRGRLGRRLPLLRRRLIRDRRLAPGRRRHRPLGLTLGRDR